MRGSRALNADWGFEARRARRTRKGTVSGGGDHTQGAKHT